MLNWLINVVTDFRFFLHKVNHNFRIIQNASKNGYCVHTLLRNDEGEYIAYVSQSSRKPTDAIVLHSAGQWVRVS